jgi:hypothetical protein
MVRGICDDCLLTFFFIPKFIYQNYKIADWSLDYMHGLCLGVMKKLLVAWTEGPRGVTLSATSIQEISRRLIAIRNFIPSDFAIR